jgi:PDZ domain-containing protein
VPIRRLLTPGVLLLSGAALAGVTFLILWQFPAGNYVFLPDQAHPVAPLVSVAGGHEPKGPGGIYFVDVIVRKASLLEDSFHEVLPAGASIEPASAVNPPGVSDAAREEEDLREMTRSQDIAAAVALRALGYKVVARPTGALISEVLEGSPAAGKLRPTDVVVAVQGKPVRTVPDLRRLIGSHRPGDSLTLTVRTGRGLHTVRIKTIADPENPHRPIIGVIPDQAADIQLPFPVRIDAQGVGGPSAGLAFALDVMEELGRNVAHGYRVAATGELQLDGSVTPIGGVEQKTVGARKTKVDVFLVPAGDNAREASKYAHGLRVVSVQSFRQALRALATLPPKT